MNTVIIILQLLACMLFSFTAGFNIAKKRKGVSAINVVCAVIFAVCVILSALK